MKQANRGLGPGQVTYQIRVQGRLSEDWSDWINGMTITFETERGGRPITTLTGTVVDQVKLRGILSRIWDLNLTVISVVRIDQEEDKPQSDPHPQPHSQPGGE
jgi:hypothetical protein